MKKIAILAAITAVITGLASFQIRYFYYWTSKDQGFVSWSGFTNAGKTAAMAHAHWESVDGMQKVCRVEAYGIRNDYNQTKVTLTDYWTTNTTASAAFGPCDPSLYKYIVARISFGAYGTIYADGTW